MNVEVHQATVAVTYGRVSSVAQKLKGHGLVSQETRCREFARMKGYTVERSFNDEAVSGSRIDRPGMKAMLDYLRVNRKRASYVVIIDDISRLARSIQAHLELRSAIASVGARLESPSIEFGEDSDAILVENLLASVSQHARQKGAEQTKNRMRERFRNGYWPFIACIGLRHVHKPGEGRVLIRDEPLASIIQEGLEGFASGRFQQQIEVARFFETHPEFPKNQKGKVRQQLVKDIMTKPIYAGYMEAPADWGLPLHKGRHAPIISYETYQRVQERLSGTAYAPARADIRSDFPLRGAVACAHCGKALTSYYATSKTGARHPYYMCFGKGCTRYGKSIKRDRIEGAFDQLLQSLTPTPGLIAAARAMFKDAWNQRLAQASEIAKTCENKLAAVEKEIGTLLDRIIAASSNTVVAAYEKRIAELERSKIALAEQQASQSKCPGSFEQTLELALRFLANPYQIWRSGNLEVQKMVLRLTFAEHLAWCPDQGFRTPQTTVPFKFLGLSGEKRAVADRAGFEPAIRFPVYTLSRRAPSTTRPPVRRAAYGVHARDFQGLKPRAAQGCVQLSFAVAYSRERGHMRTRRAGLSGTRSADCGEDGGKLAVSRQDAGLSPRCRRLRRIAHRWRALDRQLGSALHAARGDLDHAGRRALPAAAARRRAQPPSHALGPYPRKPPPRADRCGRVAARLAAALARCGTQAGNRHRHATVSILTSRVVVAPVLMRQAIARINLARRFISSRSVLATMARFR